MLITIVMFLLILSFIKMFFKVYPVDLGVLIDGSMNAGQDNFNKELEFVRKLFDRFVA